MDCSVSDADIERVIAEEFEKGDIEMDTDLIDYCFLLADQRSHKPLSRGYLYVSRRRVWRRVSKALREKPAMPAPHPLARAFRMAAALLTVIALLFAAPLLPRRFFNSRSTPDQQQYLLMGITRDNIGAALAAGQSDESSYTDGYVSLNRAEDIPGRLGYGIDLPKWLPEGSEIRSIAILRDSHIDSVTVHYQSGDKQIFLDFTYYWDVSALSLYYEQNERGKTITLGSKASIYVAGNEQSLWGLYQDERISYQIDTIGYGEDTLVKLFNSI